MKREDKRIIIGVASLVLLAIYLFLDSRLSPEIISWNWIDSFAHFVFYSWVAISSCVKIQMVFDRQERWLNKTSLVLFAFAFAVCMTSTIAGGSREFGMGPLTILVGSVFTLGWPIVDGYDLYLIRLKKKELLV